MYCEVFIVEVCLYSVLGMVLKCMHIINVNVHGNIGKGSLVIITSLVAIHLFLRSDKFTVCPDIKFGADIGDGSACT